MARTSKDGQGKEGPDRITRLCRLLAGAGSASNANQITCACTLRPNAEWPPG